MFFTVLAADVMAALGNIAYSVCDSVNIISPSHKLRGSGTQEVWPC